MKRTFNLADLFEMVAASVPDRIAFMCGDKRLSFRELDENANRVASALQKHGIQRGDNVGIELFNSAEYLEAFLACCKIGAAPANVNYRYVADELHQLLDSLQLKALFYDASVAQEVQKVASKLSHMKLCIQTGDAQLGVTGAVHYDDLLTSGSVTHSDPDRNDKDLYLLCTGGTTGLPKGVVWPHKSLFMGALGGGGIYFQRPPIESPEDIGPLVASAPPMSFFAIAPMMHGAAMWGTLISLLAGHAVVVNDQHHFDPEHILDITARDQVSIISMVGDAMALPLVKALEANPGRWDLRHLRVIGNGGALVSAHVQERLKAALPHIALSNGMGSSETGLMGSGDKPTKGEGFMVLKARPDLAVISESHEILSTPGDTGVLARSGYTPIAYFGDAKKSAEVFITVQNRLWVLSGDHARIDEDGNIVILGRGSQCINTGGEKVFPEEVEEASRRYAAVADVLVVGLADDRWGQKVVAVVEVAKGQAFDRQEFDRVCREKLSGYKVPKAVFIAPQIKRSPAGKADYRWAAGYAAQTTPLAG
jgi:fatty-acyl-CoA synthase